MKGRDGGNDRVPRLGLKGCKKLLLLLLGSGRGGPKLGVQGSSSKESPLKGDQLRVGATTASRGGSVKRKREGGEHSHNPSPTGSCENPSLVTPPLPPHPTTIAAPLLLLPPPLLLQ